MWAAADDTWLPSFLEKNLRSLAKSSNYVGSISRVEFANLEKEHVLSEADTPLLGALSARMKLFLSDPSDNSRFYSLYRRTALGDLHLDQWRMHGLDWLVVAIILKRGELTGVDEVLMKRKRGSLLKYKGIEAEDNKNYVTLGFPLLPLTVELFRNLPFTVVLPSTFSLLKLNFKFWLLYRTTLYKLWCKVFSVNS